MKKIVLLIAVVFAAYSTSMAQTFQAGLKAGISASKVTVKDLQNSPEEYDNPENIAGYHAGIFTRFQVGGIFLQPEAMVVSSGGKIEFTDAATGGLQTSEFDFNRLDVPIMLGYNFLKVLRVQAGPVASVVFDAKQQDVEIDEYMNRTDWGWQAGVGVDLAALTLDLRYENIGRDFTNTVQQSSGKYKTEQFILSLGFKLVK